MAKRRRRKRGQARWLVIVAIALLIAGFMARRLMMPSAARYLSHPARDDAASRPEPEAPQNDNQPAARSNGGAGEHLSDSDRRALDEVIRRKTGGH
jgi:uncharacterized membrane protein